MCRQQYLNIRDQVRQSWVIGSLPIPPERADRAADSPLQQNRRTIRQAMR
jgi:hypothetical protein